MGSIEKLGTLLGETGKAEGTKNQLLMDASYMLKLR